MQKLYGLLLHCLWCICIINSVNFKVPDWSFKVPNRPVQQNQNISLRFGTTWKYEWKCSFLGELWWSNSSNQIDQDDLSGWNYIYIMFMHYANTAVHVCCRSSHNNWLVLPFLCIWETLENAAKVEQSSTTRLTRATLTIY